MRTLASWTIVRGGAPQTIELLQGDLTEIPPEHAVDVDIFLRSTHIPTCFAASSTTIAARTTRRSCSPRVRRSVPNPDARRDGVAGRSR
jgi:hypothetical protein